MSSDEPRDPASPDKSPDKSPGNSSADGPVDGTVDGTADGPMDGLFGSVYGELRGLAQNALRAQRTDHTLQPTALVHEVWLKLSKGFHAPESRAHFLAVAAKAMRQILTDHARAHRADKRGQRAVGIEVEASSDASGSGEVDLIAFEDTLTKLSQLNERHAQIAELRILGGLTMPEIAETVGLSLRTIEMDWTFARAWLRAELAEA